MAAKPRICREPVAHRSTFRAVLRRLHAARQLVRYRGRYYRLLVREPGFALLRQVDADPLPWLQERMADYEDYLARLLLCSVTDADDHLRARTTNVQLRSGIYRQRSVL